jgi:hypothetical protein
MRGSKFEKTLRLLAAHARQPRYARRYMANLFVPPIASGLPWFTFSAIEFLETWIKSHHEIFEYGCGGSTLFFAQRARSVASVEHNGKWARTVTAAALKRGLSNVAIGVREADACRFALLPGARQIVRCRRGRWLGPGQMQRS